MTEDAIEAIEAISVRCARNFGAGNSGIRNRRMGLSKARMSKEESYTVIHTLSSIRHSKLTTMAVLMQLRE